MNGMKRGKRALGIATLASLLVLTLAVGAPVAYAASFTVTNTNDSGPGSLRQAVLDANLLPGPDTIDFSVTGTITLTSGQLTVTDDLTIDGPGAASLTVSGNNASRILELVAGKTLNVEGLTVANGSAPGGGGILNSGTLTVANSILTRNSANGCVFGNCGAGILNQFGTVTVTHSTFSENSTDGYGGGIFNFVGTVVVTNSTFSANTTVQFGGGIANQGSLTVTDSTFSGNENSGILNSFGTLTVTNSTFSGNRSQLGGGILNNGDMNVVNSTFSANAANLGGGIWSNVSTTLINSTLSGNSADDGGGIRNSGTFTLRNTIVANSPSGGNCSGVIIDGLGNLQHPGTDCGATIMSADPLLGPLQDNGGPTETMALLPGSPAIDAGVACPPPATDQRGVLRPQGAACDIGAFELEVAACPPEDDDRDDDGLDDSREDVFGNLLNTADSDDDGIRDGNDDGDDDGEDDEDEDDGTDPCPEDGDGDGEDDEDEDDDEDDD